MGGVDAGGLDDASFFGDVAVEDGEAAIGAEGVREVADDSGVAVEATVVRTPKGAARKNSSTAGATPRLTSRASMAAPSVGA
jgi:hypothetical protein